METFFNAVLGLEKKKRKKSSCGIKEGSNSEVAWSVPRPQSYPWEVTQFMLSNHREAGSRLRT